MTSDLQRIAQALVDCLDQVPQVVAYLHRMAHRCREQAGFVAEVAGANSSARNAALLLEDAANRCEEAAHLVQQAALRARAWAEQMVSGAHIAGRSSTPGDRRSDAPAGSTTTSEDRRERKAAQPHEDKAEETKPAAGDAGTRDDSPLAPGMSLEPGRGLSDADAADMLAALPVRVEKLGHREKTRGLWRDSDAHQHELVSGHSDYFAQAEAFAVEHSFVEPPGTLGITSHVEIKFAMMMREKDLRHETIVINKKTCEGEASCETWLPYFLPPGATLTVYGPGGFTETYPKTPPSGRTIPT